MKAKKLTSTKGMSKETWLELRRAGITGTRIAGIMGVSPWETPRSVYLDILGLKPEKEATEPMYWGTTLEDIIAKEFALRTQLKVRRVNYMLQHSTYDFLLGNIDRVVMDGKQKAILECKNVGAYSSDEWRQGVPMHYLYQVQFYLLLTGIDVGFITALVGGQKLVIHRIEADKALHQQMIDAATEFWFGNVQAGIEPDVTHQDTELLGKLYQARAGAVEEITEELYIELQTRKQLYDLHDRQYEESKNKLKDAMREAELAVFQGEKIATWKADKNGKRTLRM